ncbi:MAG TPA: FAD-dependent oxidoreductase [Acidimicrobiales bacterium]|nr:FAD-dependent oxidoreductase [Acidimicrobiales bacterium]
MLPPEPASTLAGAPVVIVGGGPVGLATALELAYHGIESLVLERRPEVSWLRPRAKTTSARTMEHLRRWGLAASLRERAALPVTWSHEAVFCTSLGGREITRISGCFGLDLVGSELVAEPGQQVAQPVVEQVLREAVATSGLARLVTGVEVTAVGEAAGAAWVAAVDGCGTRHRIDAEYVIGCEGARSVVRTVIGATYQGRDDCRPNFNVVFRAPGLAERIPHGPAVHYWVLDPAQPSLVGRLDLDATWWCIAQGVDAPTGEADPLRIVRRLVGLEQPVEVLATDAWRARMLLVDRYRNSRLFIAGDAAHQNPPWGGHGFNTGIGDAVNLGWKLAAVLAGWAPPTLLDSYEAERRPVAARTIDEARRNMATLAPELADPRLHGDGPDFEAARQAVAESIQASKDSEFHSLELTLGYEYSGSPIVVADQAVAPAPSRHRAYRPSAAPGHRLPHRWLAPGRSLYDQLGRELTLIGDLSDPAVPRLARAADDLGIPLDLLHLEGAVQHLGAPLALVRPDQHVAWRGGAVSPPEALLRLVIGHRTPEC